MKTFVSKEQREQIIRTYLEVSPEAAQRLADGLKLSPLYAFKLVQARGLLPRKRREWGQLRESRA